MRLANILQKEDEFSTFATVLDELSKPRKGLYGQVIAAENYEYVNDKLHILITKQWLE